MKFDNVRSHVAAHRKHSMAIPPSAPAPTAAPAAGDPSAQGAAPQGQTVCITDNGDGSYSVGPDSDDDQGGQDDDSQMQQMNSLPEALKAAAALLQGATDPKAAWQAEASKRDASGMPSAAPGGAPAPQMSM